MSSPARGSALLLWSLAACAEGCNLLLPYAATPLPADAASPRREAAADLRDEGGAPADLQKLDARRADATVNHDGMPPPGDAAVSVCAAGTVLCAGRCVSGTDCRGCAGAPLLCRAQNACVPSCKGCAPAVGLPWPIECFACTPDSQKDPIGTCEPDDTSAFCLSGDYSAAHLGLAGEHCDCSGGKVANCLSDHHVCVKHGATDWCVTCGEALTPTHGLVCKNGYLCNTSLVPPRCE
jgi:hypothetical protein